MKTSFGRSLWCVRKRKGLTQAQIAAELQRLGISVSRGTYAKIEAGIRGISIEELQMIRKVLDVAWEELLEK